MIRFKPLFSPAILRILGSDVPELEVLQPEEIESVHPPAMLPDMLDRVTGTDEHSILAYHLAAALETTVRHAAVIRRTYRNALVNRNGYATWKHRERYRRSLSVDEFTGPITRVPEARYCNNYVVWRYFGHWLTDAIPASLIDRDMGVLWMPPNPLWSHANDYLRVLNLQITPAELLHAERLTTYQDFGQGSHKQARYAAIRDQLQARFGNGDASECVYIMRGRTGAPRWIRNEDALVDALAARGWQVIDIANASMPDLQRVLCRARIVVSIDGSHLCHAQLSLLPGSAMVILVPHDRFTSVHIGYCRANRVSPGLVVATGSQNQGYHIDLDEVLRTVDLAEAGAQRFRAI